MKFVFVKEEIEVMDTDAKVALGAMYLSLLVLFIIAVGSATDPTFGVQWVYNLVLSNTNNTDVESATFIMYLFNIAKYFIMIPALAVVASNIDVNLRRILRKK